MSLNTRVARTKVLKKGDTYSVKIETQEHAWESEWVRHWDHGMTRHQALVTEANLRIAYAKSGYRLI